MHIYIYVQPPLAQPHCLHSHDLPLLVSSEIFTASVFPIQRIRHTLASISLLPVYYRSFLLFVLASLPAPFPRYSICFSLSLSFVSEFNIIKLDLESTSVSISSQHGSNKSVVTKEKCEISGNEITFLSVAIRANFERRFDTSDDPMVTFFYAIFTRLDLNELLFDYRQSKNSRDV